MSDNDTERLRLKRKYLNLLYEKQLLEDEQKDLLAREQYFELMQWTNYRDPLEKQLELQKNVLRKKELQLDAEIVKVTFDIDCLDQISDQCLTLDVKPKYELGNHSISLPISFQPSTDNKNQKISAELYHHVNAIPYLLNFLKTDEALYAELLMCRNEWYLNKQLNWCTHLIVWLKTWQLGIIIIFVEIKYKFKPLHKPRL